MSYSFSVRAATKAEAITAASAKFDEIVEQQPIHEADRAEAQSSVEAMVGALGDIASCDIVVSVSGSVSERDGEISSVGVNVSASLVGREG